jgi:branched-chain amino acid transport system permease protein
MALPGVALLVIGVLIDFSIFLMVTLSLNLEVGFTNIPQFGRVIAVAAGAFTVGAIPGRLLALAMGLPAGADYASDLTNNVVVGQINNLLGANIPLSIAYFVLSLVLAGVVGGLVGWLTSRPAIRLREAYLGISLLAFGDMLVTIGVNWQPLVGGTLPVGVPDPFRWIWDVRSLAFCVVALALALVTLMLTQRLTKSPFGRTLKMLRDNEVVSMAFGKDIVKVRTRSLVIGSIIAAVAGGLEVMYVGSDNAASFTRLTWTFFPWAYMMLGGVGNNRGMVFGVLIFIIADNIILHLSSIITFLPFDPTRLVNLLVGFVIVLIVLFRPRGLIPEKTETTIPQNRIEEILKKISEPDKTA